ncbi:hypothetical protein FBU59_005914 [Linderina macrospora]|uniref:Uncharacterized protein n=1 Tax=Linderina macrospora TaxID=4868 RepID=A0ACC1J1M6_9FUNG|nr:hypothetical protein FBU59_005914 [Linderina macrospora]
MGRPQHPPSSQPDSADDFAHNHDQEYNDSDYNSEEQHSPSLSATRSQSEGARYWRDNLNNLLTPQTISEQAQDKRRTRNREAARRSRQRQREREKELIERQSKLTERMKALESELVEWRAINSSSGGDMQLLETAAGEDELSENINNIYSLTMDTLRIIGELQLQLDEITKELCEMIKR